MEDIIDQVCTATAARPARRKRASRRPRVDRTRKKKGRKKERIQCTKDKYDLHTCNNAWDRSYLYLKLVKRNERGEWIQGAGTRTVRPILTCSIYCSST
jgi:hypothetical protein